MALENKHWTEYIELWNSNNVYKCIWINLVFNVEEEFLHSNVICPWQCSVWTRFMSYMSWIMFCLDSLKELFALGDVLFRESKGVISLGDVLFGQSEGVISFGDVQFRESKGVICPWRCSVWPVRGRPAWRWHRTAGCSLSPGS